MPIPLNLICTFIILSSTFSVTTGGNVNACGVAVGEIVGGTVGIAVGGIVGTIIAGVGLGDVVGELDGFIVGDLDTTSDGIAVTFCVGLAVGTLVGAVVFGTGAIVGTSVGLGVVAFTGDEVGTVVFIGRSVELVLLFRVGEKDGVNVGCCANTTLLGVDPNSIMQHSKRHLQGIVMISLTLLLNNQCLHRYILRLLGLLLLLQDTISMGFLVYWKIWCSIYICVRSTNLYREQRMNNSMQ